MFRDPDTGKELQYDRSSRALRDILHRAGFPGLAGPDDSRLRPHSLRIGGCTCASALGGDFIAGSMGCWTSPSRHRYQHALRASIDATAFAMARGNLGATRHTARAAIELCSVNDAVHRLSIQE